VHNAGMIGVHSCLAAATIASTGQQRLACHMRTAKMHTPLHYILPPFLAINGKAGPAGRPSDARSPPGLSGITGPWPSRRARRAERWEKQTPSIYPRRAGTGYGWQRLPLQMAFSAKGAYAG